MKKNSRKFFSMLKCQNTKVRGPKHLNMKEKPFEDLDYVELFAEKLKEDNSLFEQQKMLIESQIAASLMIFKNRFGEGEEFKKNAREYLRKIGLIKNK